MTLKTMFATALGGGAMIIAIAGCAGMEGGHGTEQADCGRAASSDPDTPIVAVLGRTGELPTDISETNTHALQKVIDGSERLEADLMINGVDGGSSPPNLLVNTLMTATGKNNLQRDQNLDCKRDAAKSQFASLAKKPASDKVDLLSALRTVKRDLDGREPSQVHVVVLAPALQTETINLANHETLANPAKAINKLADAQLNFTCPGWRVYLITNNRQDGKPLGAEEDVKLKAWWSSYITRCGGNLVTYNNHLARFPLDDRIAEGADTRRLPVRIQRTAREITVTVGGDLLFATDSAALRLDAAQGLERVLPLLGEADGIITVTGHTDNRGDSQHNLDLSRRRAETVANWLAPRAGIPTGRLQIVGKGSSMPVATNATTAGRQHNRRVVVTIEKTVR